MYSLRLRIKKNLKDKKKNKVKLESARLLATPRSLGSVLKAVGFPVTDSPVHRVSNLARTIVLFG